MKRIIILIATFIATHLAFAQTAKEVYQKYEHKKGSSTLTIVTDYDESLKDLRILNINGFSSRVKRNLLKDLDQLSNKDYHIMASMNNEDKSIRFLIRSEKEIIKEILIANIEKNGHLILIDCNLQRKDISSVLKILPRFISDKIGKMLQRKKKSGNPSVILG